jgi:hypothetical protein
MVAKKITKKKKVDQYKAKVGCWNCDSIYDIGVDKGSITGIYIIQKKMKCSLCGCNSIKMFKEYVVEKKIMKDLILHKRIEQAEEGEKQEPKHLDHYK